MNRKILIGFGIVTIALFLARLEVTPFEKVKVGDVIAPLFLQNIHGVNVEIPNSKTRWVHLQFRHFAGCPICNLHLKSFVDRYSDIKGAGIQEVVVFHSPVESLLPYQGLFPFEVIADPKKKLYSQFGVGSSIFSLLDVRAWPAIVKGNLQKDKPTGGLEGGPLGLPADFLIDRNGKVIADHYGRYADDQWRVDELLAFVQLKEPYAK